MSWLKLNSSIGAGMAVRCEEGWEKMRVGGVALRVEGAWRARAVKVRREAPKAATLHVIDESSNELVGGLQIG